ncbi:hypothetical protein CRM90_27980 [Mycobacterium sp. ENV421]|nr:hypothetical protein CRM90_27980 [Mycobacterium sp. ENV421]
MALLRDGATRNTTAAIEDATDAIESLPTDAPMFAVVDIVTALSHLHQAAKLIASAANQLDAQAVPAMTAAQADTTLADVSTVEIIDELLTRGLQLDEILQRVGVNSIDDLRTHADDATIDRWAGLTR